MEAKVRIGLYRHLRKEDEEDVMTMMKDRTLILVSL